MVQMQPSRHCQSQRSQAKDVSKPSEKQGKNKKLSFHFYRLESAVKSMCFMVVVQGWYLSHQSSILIYLEYF